MPHEVLQTLTNASVGATTGQLLHIQTVFKVSTVYAQQKALHINFYRPHTQSCIQTSNHPVISLDLYLLGFHHLLTGTDKVENEKFL